jgi:hypothetical protein
MPRRKWDAKTKALWEQAQAHQTGPVVGHRYDQGTGGGRGLGVSRHRTRLVDEGSCRMLRRPAGHGPAMAGGVGHPREPPVPRRGRGQGVSLMSDNGSQPTSLAFMRTYATLGIHQAFTSYNNPKGNADTERFMRTLKECRWLKEWTCPLTRLRAIEDWLAHYNEHYLNSALGYQSPRQFEREYFNRHRPLFVAA